MTADNSLTAVSQPWPLRQFFWRWPEWWVLALCGLAWWAMLLHARQFAAHGVHHWMSFSQELANWLLMVLAMMLPLVRDALRTTAFASLWARRHRAMAGFLLGYLAPWLLLGIAVALLRAQRWTHTYSAASLVFAIAGLWQLTPIHTAAMISCHRTLPLAPSGWRADRDCLGFGSAIGLACALSCWPMMIACAFTGHGAVAMVGGAAVSFAERQSFRPRPGVATAGTILLAGYYAVMWALNH